MSNFDFDATQVAPAASMDVFPPGEYLMIVSEAEVKITKDGHGRIVETVNEIAEGEYAGRKIWDRFNYENKSAQAQEIGRRQLSSLCHAVGVLKLSDPQQLKNRLFRAVVKVVTEQKDEKTGKTYPAKNEISTYKTKDGLTADQVAKGGYGAGQQVSKAEPAAAVHHNTGAAVVATAGVASGPTTTAGAAPWLRQG